MLAYAVCKLTIDISLRENNYLTSFDTPLSTVGQILHFLVYFLALFSVCCMDGYNISHFFKVSMLLLVECAVIAAWVSYYLLDVKWDYILYFGLSNLFFLFCQFWQFVCHLLKSKCENETEFQETL